MPRTRPCSPTRSIRRWTWIAASFLIAVGATATLLALAAGLAWTLHLLAREQQALDYAVGRHLAERAVALLDEDPDFVERVRTLIRLRREEPLLRSVHYLHGESEIAWRTPAGRKMTARDWRMAHAFRLALGGSNLLVLINSSGADSAFSLPGEGYEVLFATDEALATGASETLLPARSVAVLRRPAVRKISAAHFANEN